MTERSLMAGLCLMAGLSIAGFILQLIYVCTRRLEFADYRMSPSTKGSHWPYRNPRVRGGTLAVLALAPRSWGQLVADNRDQAHSRR
jgi:hypothetical protein